MAGFERSLQALSGDTAGSTRLVLIAAIASAAAWFSWSLWASVPLYETSGIARLEVGQANAPLASPFVGRVVRVNLRVGQKVRRNEVLVELDSQPDQLLRQTAQARRAALQTGIEGLRAEIAAERAARAEESRVAVLNGAEADSRLAQAQALVAEAEREASQLRRLRDSGLVARNALHSAEANVLAQSSARDASRAAASRAPQEQSTRQREREVRIQRLFASIASLQAEHATLTTEIASLDYAIERRLIRAPIDGTVGEAEPLREGAVLDETERIGSIVPDDPLLHVVAQYPPTALGRIQPAQKGSIRLEAFPWSEYGAVSVHVTRVASEVRDGSVRVELDLDPDSQFRGTLGHGMPGTVEVLVERISPFALATRSAGQWMTSTR